LVFERHTPPRAAEEFFENWEYEEKSAHSGETA